MQRLTEGTTNFEPLSPEAFGTDIQQIVMPLFKRDGENLVPIGTGFIVGGDALMMTAKHVVEDARSSRQRVIGSDGRWTDLGDFYAFYFSAERHGPNNEFNLGGLWPIEKVWFTADTDIAFCWLKAAERDGVRITFKRMPISPGLPKLNEEITAFGYHGLSKPLRLGANGELVLPYDCRGSFATGRIIEVHPLRRDWLLPSPCFRTTARFDHGMSGGPVVNANGFVCGVIWSSLGRNPNSEEHTSYVSMLWPVMGAKIDVAPEQGAMPVPTSILQLVRSGYIASDGSEQAIEIVTSPEGEGVRVNAPPDWRARPA